MEYKSFDAIDLKIAGDGNGFVSGYASTFANFDSVGERVVKGAFAESLPEFLASGFVAVGHNWNALPIATPLEAKEDDHGLFVTAEFHSTQAAQDARRVIRERLERGKSAKFSIGYEVLDAENTKEGRLLRKLRLFEYSLVTVPANQMAVVTGAKGWGLELPFTEHSERLMSAVREYLDRAEDRKQFLAKEGRVLSAQNRQRLSSLMSQLAEMQQAIDELLRNTEPAPKADPEPAIDTAKAQEAEAIFAAFQALSTRLGVPL